MAVDQLEKKLGPSHGPELHQGLLHGDILGAPKPVGLPCSVAPGEMVDIKTMVVPSTIVGINSSQPIKNRAKNKWLS